MLKKAALALLPAFWPNMPPLGLAAIKGYLSKRLTPVKRLDFILKNHGLIPKIGQVNPFVYYEGLELPREADYRSREESVERAHRFIDSIGNAGFKFTNAFMMNLVEPEWK